MSILSRRRFIAITAGAAVAGPITAAPAAAAAPSAIWRGTALGARAAIWFSGVSAGDNAALIAMVRAEIDRLEKLFSLYRADSAISRLNKSGRLAAPDPDVLALLTLAGSVHRATGGLFDPTVQPVWNRLARHLAGSPGTEPDRRMAGSPPVNFGDVLFDVSQVTFTRPGMALTLNGIAQGFITDKVVDVLKRAGMGSILVEAGEYRAIGSRGDGKPWPVRIAGRGVPGSVAHLDDRALATSDTYGTTLDAAGRIGHIVDPRTQVPARRRALVSVTAPSAAVADGLSTALCMMDSGGMESVVAQFPGARVAYAA